MKLINKIKNGTLSISEDCDLAVLINTNKSSLAYNRAFERIKKLIVKQFEEDNFEYQDIDVHAELSSLLEEYQKNI